MLTRVFQMSGVVVVYDSRGMKFTIADDRGDPETILSRLPPFPSKESSTLQPAGPPGRWILVMPEDVAATVTCGFESLHIVVLMNAPVSYVRRLVERLSIFRSHVPGRSFPLSNIQATGGFIVDALEGSGCIIALGNDSSPYVPSSIQFFRGGSSPSEIPLPNRYDRVFASQLLNGRSALIFGPFRLSPSQRLDTLLIDGQHILDLVQVRLANPPSSHVVDAFCFYFRVFEAARGKSPPPMKPVVRHLVGEGRASPSATGNLFNLFSFFFQKAREIDELM
jgi:hypothetical protein